MRLSDYLHSTESQAHWFSEAKKIVDEYSPIGTPTKERAAKWAKNQTQ